MTDKKRKKARELQAKTGMPYAAAINKINVSSSAVILYQGMDRAVDAFCESVAEQVQSWYTQVLDEVRSSNPQVSKDLQSRGLLEKFDSQVGNLFRDLQSRTVENINVESIWWHRATDKGKYPQTWDIEWGHYFRIGEDPYGSENSLHGKIKYLLGLLDDLLWHYNYLEDPSEWSTYVNKKGVVTYQRVASVTFKWSPKMTRTIRRYATLQQKVLQQRAHRLKEPEVLSQPSPVVHDEVVIVDAPPTFGLKLNPKYNPRKRGPLHTHPKLV